MTEKNRYFLLYCGVWGDEGVNEEYGTPFYQFI